MREAQDEVQADLHGFKVAHGWPVSALALEDVYGGRTMMASTMTRYRVRVIILTMRGHLGGEMDVGNEVVVELSQLLVAIFLRLHAQFSDVIKRGQLAGSSKGHTTLRK